MRRLVAVLACAVMTWPLFAVPSFAAPLPSLASGGCVTSVCGPQGASVLAELSLQNGVTTSGTALTASEQSAFAGIVSDYYASGTASAGPIVSVSSGSGFSTAVKTLLSGFASGLTSYGALSASGTVADPTPIVPSAGFTYTSMRCTSGQTCSKGTNANTTYPDRFSLVVDINVTYGTTINSVRFQCLTDSTWADCGRTGTSDTQACNFTGFTTNGTWQYYGGYYCDVNFPNYSSVRFAAFSGSTVVASVIYAASSPTGTLEQSLSCVNASGAAQTVTNSAMETWTAGQMVSMAQILCPTGYRPTGLTRTAVVAGTSTVLSSNTYPTPAGSPCDYVGTTVCVLTLQYASSSSTGTRWLSCHTAAVGTCADWSTNVDRSSLYRCTYGLVGTVGVVVSLGSCSIFVASFQASGTSTLTPPAPLPLVTPADPSCDFSVGSVLDGSVFKAGIVCALSAAFVPTPASFAAVRTQMSGAWDSSRPGVLISSATSALDPLTTLFSGQSSSCGGITYSFPLLPDSSPTVIHLIDSCSEPFKTLAPIVRALLSLSLVVLGAWAVLRLLGVSIGLNFGRVNGDDL